MATFREPTNESQKTAGDPFWFSPYLEILAAVGSFATIGSFIINLLRTLRDKKDAARLKKIHDSYNDLQFEFLRYKDGTKRLFTLLKENDKEFNELTMALTSFSTVMDAPHYRLYLEIKQELRSVKERCDRILDTVEGTTIEIGVDTLDSELRDRLFADLDAIMKGWGEMGITDLLQRLKSFNDEFDRSLGHRNEIA